MALHQVTSVVLKGPAVSHAPQESSGLLCKTAGLQVWDVMVALALTAMG